MKLTLRDLFWLMLVIGIVLGWRFREQQLKGQLQQARRDGIQMSNILGQRFE